MEPIDHPVSRYAIGVVEGDIVAGDLVRMACERHLMDLETGADRGLYFDCQAASQIIRWAGMLQHTTGPMAGMPLKLEPWQEFRHGSVFGWKRSETGLRRFQSTYHQVGKKNGKTTDTAVPMLGAAAIDMDAWRASEDETMELSDYAGRKAYIGVDLATRKDPASVVVLIPDGKLFRLFSWHFLPEKIVDAPGNEHLWGWKKKDLIWTTPGAELDLNMVEALVLQLASLGDDTWGWRYCCARCQRRGAHIPGHCGSSAAILSHRD